MFTSKSFFKLIGEFKIEFREPTLILLNSKFWKSAGWELDLSMVLSSVTSFKDSFGDIGFWFLLQGSSILRDVIISSELFTEHGSVLGITEILAGYF